METGVGVKDCIKAYWNAMSRDYERFRRIRIEEEISAWKSVFGDLLGYRPCRVLDVGTGTGFVARTLAEMGHEVTGVDVSEDMLEVARDLSLRRGLNVEFLIGDAENLEFDDESFDAVVCRYVVWTLPDPDRAVREWTRVLRGGGKIVIVDGIWCDGSITSRVKVLAGKVGMLVHERINPFRFGYSKEVSSRIPFVNGVEPERIAKMLEMCGVDEVGIRWLDDIREMWLRNLPPLFRLSWNRPIYAVYGTKRE